MGTSFEEVTKIFLTPASILFSALGVAKTEGMKSGISVAGMLIALLWIAAGNAPRALLDGHQLMALLPGLFYAAWAISLAIHFPRHLRYKAEISHARRGRKSGAIVALAPAVADLFDEVEINAILMAHASLGAQALRAARLPTPLGMQAPAVQPAHPAPR